MKCMSESIITNTKLCKTITNRIYENLRLTISDFDKISYEIINDEIKETLTHTTLVDGMNWNEVINYEGKMMSFNMLVFETKKRIQSKQ